MERLTDSNLEQAKLYFYQLLVSRESYSYREIFALMTENMKNLLQADSVALYIYDEWQQRLERVSYAGPRQRGFRLSIDYIHQYVCMPDMLREFPHVLDRVLPLQHPNESVIGFLYVGGGGEKIPDCRELAWKIGNCVTHLIRTYQAKEDEQHTAHLYEATTNLHASIDMHDVLRVPDYHFAADLSAIRLCTFARSGLSWRYRSANQKPDL